MKRTLQALAVVCLFAVAAFGQGASNYGSLTAASTDCSTAGSCVTLLLPNNTSSVAIDLDGTFSGTQQFESQAAPGASWRAIKVTPIASSATVSSATAVGSWRVAVGGLNAIRVRTSAYNSGTAVVNINASPAAASLGGGLNYASGGAVDTVPESDGAGGLRDSPIITDNAVGFRVVEGAAPSGVASSDVFYADSTDHGWNFNNNNGGAFHVVGSSGATNNVLCKFSSGNCTNSLHTDNATSDTYTGAGGLISPAYSSSTASVASAGQIRLASADTISWRNAAGGADVALAKTGAVSGSIAADSFDLSGFGAVRIPVGAVGTPGLLFNGQTAGLFWQSTWGISFASTSTATDFTVLPAGAGVLIPTAANSCYRWSNSSTNAGATGQTFICSAAAATIQLGFTNLNGTPVNQTLRTQGAVTGTDLPGGRLDIFAGPGTGAGATQQTSISRALMAASSGTTQTTANAITVCESKTLSNTSATTTTFATIGLASNAGGGASVTITLVATDGTNFDAETQSVNLSYVNKATVMTVSTPTITASSAANNSGSATIGFTATGASPTISLKVTPAFTTIVPTTVTMYAEINNHGAGAVSCQ